MIQSGILAKFSATVPRVERAAPLLGQHTQEILSRYLGYDAARIADLKIRGKSPKNDPTLHPARAYLSRPCGPAAGASRERSRRDLRQQIARG